jgi:sortase A
MYIKAFKDPDAATLSDVLRWATYACLAIGLILISSAGYIQSKAQVAQLLIARAYQKQLDTNEPQKPWPWADTVVMAKLIIKQNADYILADASMRNLAFGPTHVSHTAKPGTYGNSVIVGHRDTHFEKLKDVELGELIQIEKDGVRIHYRVAEKMIVDDTEVAVMESLDANALTLITCYPFNSIDPNPKQRFVVRAIKEA